MPGHQGVLLFPDEEPTAPSKPWSVSRLNREVRDCVESRIGNVWVEGEISNLRRQPSGHQYFSLKDDTAQVSCVLFRSAATPRTIRDGMQVEILGQISVYEPRGQYQIVVRRVQQRGAGELEAKLRALQEKLRAEGLFEQNRKRPLPPHPVRVGVVTSPAGAAIRDFLHVLRRRAPHIEVFVAPVRVQGRGAAVEIAAAVRKFTELIRSGFPPVDVVVVTRGGGSLEDLWEFNEEVVARAITASAMPVISAVGHETDITTSDLVADVRAATPSAAAEILSADSAEALNRLLAMRRRLGRDALVALDRARAALALRASAGVFREPLRRIIDSRQSVDDLHVRSSNMVEGRLSGLRAAAGRADDVLRARSPRDRIAALKAQLRQLGHRHSRAATSLLERYRQRQSRHAHALELLGPRQTLARGFTITMDHRRHPLTSARQAAGQREIVTLFADGEIVSTPSPEER